MNVKASAKLKVINKILERDGCVVIEGVLNALQVETLAAELAPHFDAAPNCGISRAAAISISAAASRCSIPAIAIRP